ncbi:energizing module transmembrane component of thiamin-regulated hydroxymethylpyrimidine ECF transporter [Lacticaseibacillus paracasei]|nr:energizing module transmembrane component of thiamin-regulated hydroxymethylpyrimidine ECF transporter [Lacticaseibacillus paracasei]
MAQKKTDALNLSLLILALTLEISFSHAVKLNVALIVLALVFLGGGEPLEA